MLRLSLTFVGMQDYSEMPDAIRDVSKLGLPTFEVSYMTQDPENIKCQRWHAKGVRSF